MYILSILTFKIMLDGFQYQKYFDVSNIAVQRIVINFPFIGKTYKLLNNFDPAD